MVGLGLAALAASAALGTSNKFTISFDGECFDLFGGASSPTVGVDFNVIFMDTCNGGLNQQVHLTFVYIDYICIDETILVDIYASDGQAPSTFLNCQCSRSGVCAGVPNHCHWYKPTGDCRTPQLKHHLEHGRTANFGE